jgi:hypothetical protein
MDENALLDEKTLSDLFDLVAADEAPPCRVSIAAARSRGRRRIRLRRIYLPGLAPVAAAVAVGLVVSLPAGLHTGAGSDRGAAHRAVLGTAPTQFSPLLPYASFGWLPPGLSVTGVANATTQSSTQLSLTATGTNRGMVSLRVTPAGFCQITGPLVGKGLSVKGALARKRGATAAKGNPVKTTYPHALTCAEDGSGGGLPLLGTAPQVNGAPAFWTASYSLVWEYARDAWARLSRPLVPSQHAAATAPQGQLPKNALIKPPSAAALAQIYKIAANVRYGYPSAVGYGFTIGGLPANWRSARAGATYDVASLEGRLVDIGWSAGPAADPGALSISVYPAKSAGGIGSCKYIAGQSSHVTIDGVLATLRTIDLPGKHWQSLCAANIDGLALYATLDLANPNTTSDTPLPGGAQVGSLVTIFGHLRLLGPDVATWTSNPPA